MTNKTQANISLTMLFSFIAYVLYLLGFNTYSQGSLIYFMFLSMFGALIFTGAFVYFKFFAKAENQKIKTVGNAEDTIKHFVEPKEEVIQEPIDSKEKVVETQPKKTEFTETQEAFENPDDALQRALAALNQTNEIDKDIKRDF